VAPQAAQVTITNSTVSGNIAATSEFNSGEGGGIRSTGTVRLIQATVVDNAAGRGSNVSASTLETFGSVIALSSGDSCWVDTLNDSGYSYSDDDSCGLAGTGSTDDGADPALGALADNGGPTRTYLPDRLTSPLVDAIPFVLCPVAVTADQRGIPRPQGNGCDIGAVEVVSQIVSADIVVANDDNGTATGADFTIEVYDTGGTLVASGPDPEPGTGNASAEFVLAAGNYTFGVSGPAGYVTAVVVTIVPAAAEIIDDASAQFTLTPGEVVSAVLTADDIAPATTTTTTTTLAPTTTQGPTTTAIGVLPATGNDQSSTLALVAAMLVLLGAGTLLVTRRR
jgi:LPXTG-motif cell wall-anchored protein